VVKVGEQALGDRETIRVNASARASDDWFIGQEVVADGTNLARLWTGLGGKLDRRCDSSFLLTHATFKLLPDGLLPIPFHTPASDTNAATAQS